MGMHTAGASQTDASFIVGARHEEGHLTGHHHVHVAHLVLHDVPKLVRWLSATLEHMRMSPIMGLSPIMVRMLGNWEP